MLGNFFDSYTKENDCSFADKIVLAIHAELLRLGFVLIERKDGKDQDNLAFDSKDYEIATRKLDGDYYLRILPSQWKDKCMYKMLYMSPQLDIKHPQNTMSKSECGASLKAVLFDNELKVHIIDTDAKFQMINLELDLSKLNTDEERANMLSNVRYGVIDEISSKWPLQRHSRTHDNIHAETETTECDDGSKVVTRKVQSVYSHRTHARPTNLIGRDDPIFGLTGPRQIQGIRQDWVSPIGNVEPDNDIQRPPNGSVNYDVYRQTQTGPSSMPSALGIARSLSREGSNTSSSILLQGPHNTARSGISPLLTTSGILGPDGLRTSPVTRLGQSIEGEFGSGAGPFSLPGLRRGNSGPFGGGMGGI